VRKLLLRIHLWLGVAAGVFLIVLGLTGSIIAFEGDIDHWLHPGNWYVSGNRGMPEGALIAAVELRVAPARVGAVEIPQQHNLAQRMSLTDGTSVTVNPYTGAILSRLKRPTATDRVLGDIHQLHLRLAFNGRAAWAPAGKVIVSYAGLILCILAPTGVLLWFRTKRASVKWQQASWFRRCFDLHLAIGIWAGFFLFVAGFTGILIGFESGEKAIYTATHSERPKFGPRAQSVPQPGANPIGVDRAIEIARAALPAGAVDMIFLPVNSKAAYDVVVRVPEETSGSAHSDAVIDQYTGAVLQSRNFLTDSQGYRWIRFNRAIHTGDAGGLFGHIVMSLTSLALAAMVVTGFVIWLKKLAV
jgi:uncharacterized iron-regulated membrane protein